MKIDSLETVNIHVYNGPGHGHYLVSSSKLHKNVSNDIKTILEKYGVKVKIPRDQGGRGGGDGGLLYLIIDLIKNIKDILGLLTFWFKLLLVISRFIKWKLYMNRVLKKHKRPTLVVNMQVSTNEKYEYDYDYIVGSLANNLLNFSEEIHVFLTRKYSSYRFERAITVNMKAHQFNLKITVPHNSSGNVDQRLYDLVNKLPTRDYRSRNITKNKLGLIRREEHRFKQSKLRSRLLLKKSNTYFTIISVKVMDDFAVKIRKRKFLRAQTKITT